MDWLVSYRIVPFLVARLARSLIGWQITTPSSHFYEIIFYSILLVLAYAGFFHALMESPLTPWTMTHALQSTHPTRRPRVSLDFSFGQFFSNYFWQNAFATEHQKRVHRPIVTNNRYAKMAVESAMRITQPQVLNSKFPFHAPNELKSRKKKSANIPFAVRRPL